MQLFSATKSGNAKINYFL